MDLSDLTDDQLVELARLVAAEIGRRHPDVGDAARSVALDEAEKARVAKTATDAEIARLRDLERRRIDAEARAAVLAAAPPIRIVRDPGAIVEAARRKAVGIEVARLLGAGWTLTVWRRDTERRVYLDRGSCKITCWLTGSREHAPGSLQLRGVKADRKALQRLAELAGGWWHTLRHLDCDDAAASADVEAAPLPATYKEART